MNWIKRELEGWKAWEITWLSTAVAVITCLSVYWGDTLMGIISASTGVACVVCTGKGKLSAYTFGLVNCVLYSIISFNAQLYGETMLNTLYYIPMQFVGFYVWSRHMDEETKEVEKKHMGWTGRLLLAFSMLTGTVIYGFMLRVMNDAMPFVDAFTTVSSVIAMIVSVKMFAEQWWIWVAIDVFSVYMWYCNFMTGSDNMATLLMWVVYLGNAIIMLIKWESESRKGEAVYEV
jgi:nicotinamide mononucleotide transporter